MTITTYPEPTIDDLTEAAERLKGIIARTPLLESHALNTRVGGRVLIKPECLQHTGSFKFRGASNRIAFLSPEKRQRGVVAFSSGNHAQAVALAAAKNDIAATIVMPADAPAIKVANTKSYGADVVFYDRLTDDREEIAHAICEKTGATLVRPFDDPQIIAGQGTIGLEIIEEAKSRGLSVDQLLVPCSGGGLVAGCGLAFEASSPDTAIYGVEPEHFDDTARSLAAGARVEIAPENKTICDALALTVPGELTFQINQRLLQAVLTVTDDQVREAMGFAFDHLKLVVEPGGAVALAALLKGRIAPRDGATALILSGGNVDRALFRSVIAD